MRVFSFALALVLCLMLSACGGPNASAPSGEIGVTEPAPTETKGTGYLPGQLQFSSGDTVYTVQLAWGEDCCDITSDIPYLEHVFFQYDTAAYTLTVTNKATPSTDDSNPTSSRSFDTLVYRFDSQGYLIGIQRDGEFYSEITYENDHSSFAWRQVSGATSDGPVIDTVNGTAQGDSVNFQIPIDGLLGDLSITYDQNYIRTLTMEIPENEPTQAKFSYKTDGNGELVSFSDGMTRMTCSVTPSDQPMTNTWQKLSVQAFYYLSGGVAAIAISLLIAMCYVNA